MKARNLPAGPDPTPKVPEDTAAVGRASEMQSGVQAAAFLAATRPRDEQAARDRLHETCRRPEFAEGAEYTFDRGGTEVSGASVRLAREVARCWGNLRHGVRILALTDTDVHLEGWCWDLESNTHVSVESRFMRLVERKAGRGTEWVRPNERQLRELVAKQGAVAVRNAILQVIPTDVVEGALAVCHHTLKAEAGKGSREDQLRALLASFAEYEVTPGELERFVGRVSREWTKEDVVRLRQAFRAIRDGEVAEDVLAPNMEV